MVSVIITFVSVKKVIRVYLFKILDITFFIACSFKKKCNEILLLRKDNVIMFITHIYNV